MRSICRGHTRLSLEAARRGDMDRIAALTLPWLLLFQLCPRLNKGQGLDEEAPSAGCSFIHESRGFCDRRDKRALDNTLQSTTALLETSEEIEPTTEDPTLQTTKTMASYTQSGFTSLQTMLTNTKTSPNSPTLTTLNFIAQTTWSIADSTNPNTLTSSDDTNPNTLTSSDDTNPNTLTSSDDTNPNTLTSLEDTNRNRLTTLDDTNPNTLTSLGDTNPNTLTSLGDTNPNTLTSSGDTNPNTLTSSDDTNPNTLTSSDDTNPNTLTSLEDTNRNRLTTLDDTNPNTLTSLGDTNPNTLTSLGDTNPNTLMSSGDTNPNTLTSLGDTNPNTLTPLGDTNPNTLTSLRDTNPNTLTSLHDTNPNTLTTLGNSNPNTLTSLKDTNPNTLTALHDTNPKTLTTLGNSNPNTLTTLGDSNPNTLTSSDDTNPNTLTTLHETNPNTMTTLGDSNPNTLTSLHDMNPNTMTTLDTTSPTALSELAITTARTISISDTASSSTSSTLSPTSASPSTTTRTVPSTAALTQIELWLQRSSAVDRESDALTIIDSIMSYTSSISSTGYHLSELQAILYVLGNLTEAAVRSGFQFSVDAVKKVGFITNQLFSDMSSEPAASRKNALGPQLLGRLEDIFAEMKITNKSFHVSYGNIKLYCSVASCKDVKDGIVMVLDSNSNLSLSQYDSDKISSVDCYINVVFMSYRTENGSFNSQYGNQDMVNQAYYVASDIMTKVLIANDHNYHDVTITMTFMCTDKPCDHMARCVFWDFLSNMWSSEGCTTRVTNSITRCECNHLTSFAVLMSNSDDVDDPQNTAVLDNITRVGLVISILSLIICIIFQLILLRLSSNLTASYRHISTLSMSAFLLMSNVSFLASSFLDPVTQNDVCVAFTFCIHFSTLGFFCWTVVQGLFLVCRLVFVFHHISKKEFGTFSVALGYLCPIVIATATFMVYSPTKNYRKQNACWLNISSGAALTFTIPVIIIMSVNVLVLIVVIKKLLRPSISEGGGEDEEVVKKLVKAVVFCTPQFGLTWAIGIPLLMYGDSLVLKYMFVLLNPLQGFFILLFTCLLDKKVTDLIMKRIWKTSPANSMVTTVSSY